jgi:hypothetical protein
MTHKGTVTLETERLTLRRLKLSDAEAITYRVHCTRTVPPTGGDFMRSFSRQQCPRQRLRGRRFRLRKTPYATASVCRVPY